MLMVLDHIITHSSGCVGVGCFTDVFFIHGSLSNILGGVTTFFSAEGASPNTCMIKQKQEDLVLRGNGMQ